MRKTSIIICVIYTLICLLLISCNGYADIFSVSNESNNSAVSSTGLSTPYQAIVATPTIAPTHTPLPYHQLGFVNLNDHTSNLCVRTGPDTTYPIIGAICHGLSVRIFTEIDGWYEIEFDGVVGYCSSDFIIIDSGLSEPLRTEYCIIVANKTITELRELPEGLVCAVGDDVDITGDGIVDGYAVDENDDGSADAVKIEAVDSLVDVTFYSPDIFHDVDLATTANQFGEKVYTSYNVLLQKEVYDALSTAQEEFKLDGYYIKIYDAYRPLRYQKILYNLSGDSKFFNNSEAGSNHNRGAALDMTLVDVNGKELEMPTSVHEYSQSAYRDNVNISATAATNLEYMTSIMLSCGFSTYSYEWWHFNYINAKNYPLSDYTDAEMIKIRKK